MRRTALTFDTESCYTLVDGVEGILWWGLASNTTKVPCGHVEMAEFANELTDLNQFPTAQLYVSKTMISQPGLIALGGSLPGREGGERK